MARKQPILLWTILIASVVPIISDPLDGVDCYGLEDPNKTDDPICAAGFTELYYDDTPDNREHQCCRPGSAGEKDEKWKRCQSTNCIEGTPDNVCSRQFDRHVNGKKVVWNEIIRENCSYVDGSKFYHGARGVCCMNGVLDEKLAATFGAELNEFPHQAYFAAGCGATVYNSRFILTAAHCVIDDDGVPKNGSEWEGVYLGSNIALFDPHVIGHTYKIKRAIPHEKYSFLASNDQNERNGWKRTYNDIALLELEEDIKFSDNVKALEIAPANFNPFPYAEHAVVAGWGVTETLYGTNYLHKANFILRGDEECFNVAYDGFGMYDFKDSTLCAGGILEGKFSWTDGTGDSGGPLICRNADGHPVQCGVVSGGGSDEKCTKNRDQASCVPSLFTEVAYFRDWIEKYAGSQDKTTFYRPYLYGEEVAPSKYQHQVHITSSDGKPCGGTLVQPDIVITAAHCIMKADGTTKVSDLKVTSAVNDINTRKGIIVGVTDIRILDGFKMQGSPVDIGKQGNHVVMNENFYHNDLAILKLEKKTSLEQLEFPRLPSKMDKFGSGVELAFPTNTTRSGQLRSREYKLLDLPECRKRVARENGKVGQEITVDDNTLCGVEKYTGGSLCDRELGGGLICQNSDGTEVLCGVQTFRLCDYALPNEFIDMTRYAEWVGKMISDMK